MKVQYWEGNTHIVACVLGHLHFALKDISWTAPLGGALDKKYNGHYGRTLWCWRRLLRVPWPARRLNQSILNKINTAYLLEELMLKPNPILWPPEEKSWLIEKDTDAEKDRRQEEKGTTEDKKIVKLESEFLLAEPKNEFHEYSNTHVSNW